ncbi:protein atonal homolog 8-like [Diaphorina citri]|nr:protein atonal homolog 8-like [Diaphorina citri]
MLNACVSNDSTASSCTNDSDETNLLNDSYKSKSSSQNYNRNYKNMTRERRIEANARERTRVHTISAAFETLRKTVPAYSTNQKLSKLSVLRIACSYIMTLSRIAGHDYSRDQSEPSIESCVEDVTKTIQLEGKVKKKSKEDDDD